jgi:hypothetical protein
MKKCAKCDRTYDGDYDACPYCSKHDAIKNPYEREWAKRSEAKYGRSTMSPRRAALLATFTVVMAALVLAVYFAGH